VSVCGRQRAGGIVISAPTLIGVTYELKSPKL